MGPRAGLDWRKISSPPGFDPGPSSPQSVAIPTELPGPLFQYGIQRYKHEYILNYNFVCSFVWSFKLRDERRLRVFENRVLRRIFGPNRDEVAEL